MSIWRVELDCWQRTKWRSRYAQRHTKHFIVEAGDAEAADASARAELSRSNGWLAIESLLVATMKLPVCTVTIKRETIKMSADGSKP